jgi:hypothetical protein
VSLTESQIIGLGFPTTFQQTVGGEEGDETTVQVSAAPTSVNCSGSSFVTVVVKIDGVNAPDGTAVQVESTIGSASPSSSSTSGKRDRVCRPESR